MTSSIEAPHPHHDALEEDRWLRYLDNPVTGVMPWVAMAVVTGTHSFALGVAVGLVSSLALMLGAKWRGEPMKILEVADVVLFAALLILAISIRSVPINGWFNNHADTVSNVGLALLAFGSLAVGRPFTAQYTRVRLARLPLAMRHRLDHRATLAWGLAFVAASFAGWYGEWILDNSNNIWTGWTLQTLPLIWAVIYVRWEDLRGLATLPGQASVARPSGALVRGCSIWLLPTGIAGLIGGGAPQSVAWLVIASGIVGYIAGAASAARAVVGTPLAAC